jgi:putative FmdB family regulatory protein
MVRVAREGNMPIYEYQCRGCGKRFETLVQGRSKPACPDCGGRKLDKQLSVFAVSSGDAQPSRSELPEPCRSCGHPGGPGSCGLG